MQLIHELDDQLFTCALQCAIQSNQDRCLEKRKVLSFFLNVSSVAARLMSVGRAFHRRGGCSKASTVRVYI